MSEKKSVFSHNITEDGFIEIKEVITMLEDGRSFSAIYRNTICPGGNVSKEDKRTKELANLIHTPEVVAKYKAEREKMEKI